MSLNPLPFNIFEASWEVANKVGGIYTVLASKAPSLQKRTGGKLFFIGPDLNQDTDAFIPDDDTILQPWLLHARAAFHLPVRVGRWNIPSRPLTLLVDFRPLYHCKDDLYFRIWNDFRIDSLNAPPDYDQACLFAIATAQVVQDVIRFARFEVARTLVHFNEWTLAMGLLYLRSASPNLPTLFTTHATVVGRALPDNNFDPDTAARNVYHKLQLERAAATHAHCFTAVSEITARECTRFLGVTPHFVTPNGFDPAFVPPPDDLRLRRTHARARILAVASALYGQPFSEHTPLILSSGRYEYINKGLDLLTNALTRLRDFPKPAVAVIAVPADATAPRADLLHALDVRSPLPLDQPILSHWLRHPDNDPILNYLHQLHFDPLNSALKIIFVPTYLDGHDGIFNLAYYDFLPAFDLSLFPSFYEPWGYTPLESAAFGIPTLTSDLAGFGLWAHLNLPLRSASASASSESSAFGSGSSPSEDLASLSASFAHGVAVLDRTHQPYHDAARNLADLVLDFNNLTPPQRALAAQHARDLAASAHWSSFISHYLDAFRFALLQAQNGDPTP
ncbi:MAG: glycogen/starch synthase [Tannerellaceae bacterium]|jgi:glycosyltransferase involved in cell wall biosynthesis|nr:glycogen/starch synthase [Tannerellaceae bacterium]